MRIGKTFPGVSIEQILQLESRCLDNEIIEPPKTTFEYISMTGEALIEFGEQMFYPTNLTKVDYTQIFDL